MVDADQLTDAQHAFATAPDDRRLIFGSRQVGTTTALAVDCLDHLHAGDTIVLLAGTQEIAMMVRDRVLERAEAEGTRRDLTTPRGDCIENDAGGLLEVRSAKPEANYEKLAEMADHIVIEEPDVIQPDIITELDTYSHAPDMEVTLAAGGTHTPDSANIERMVRDDDWFSVYDTVYDVNHVPDERIAKMRETTAPRQQMTEIDGLFVTDPADLADYAPPNADDRTLPLGVDSP